MSHGRRVVASALAVGLCGIAFAACGDGSGPKLTQKTLKFTEADTDNFALVDNAPKTKFGKDGPEKLSNGDQLAFQSQMLDGAKKRVGSLDATCLVTAANSGKFEDASSTCHATVTVPGGQLFIGVGGKPFASNTTTGAVTGGTGAFDGATGSFTSVGENNSKDTFHIWIPKK
ncbi:MAG: hypothetical protein QOI73_1056 [Solirubrobacteraceae bacterium]|nr:hypothetical protein [Solirubrobacteraceae bacterium]